MGYICFMCGHRWIRRSPVNPRQCPKCWKRAIEDDAEIRLASILLKPWGYLLVNLPPPPLLPSEMELFSNSLDAYASIMAKTQGNIIARANALRFMLIEAGLSRERAEIVSDNIT